MAAETLHIRQVQEDDETFVLSLASRFVDFPLPPFRQRAACLEGVRTDLLHHLDEPPPSSWLYVAEDAEGTRVGFLHLKKTRDFFNGAMNCHISDLATGKHAEGRGIGRALLAFAERWAAEHKCRLLTLSVFPGNERALHLYRESGYDTDMLRLAKPVTAARKP